LLRARFVGGSADLGKETIAIARAAALSPQPPLLGQRLLDMRARMVAERAAQIGLDLKMGEGGLADVEFAVQGLELAHHVWSPSTRRGLHALARKGAVTIDQCRALDEAYVDLVQAREALALVDDKREPAVTPSDARLDLLARAGVLAGKSGAEVYARLAKRAATIREISGRILLRLA
jgi:glutamate-ammonia-ligase adenylyltransferase